MFSQVKSFLKHGFAFPDNLGYFKRLKSTDINSTLSLLARSDVQDILLELSHVDMNVVFKSRNLKKPFRPPKYIFVTDAGLEKLRSRSLIAARKLLQPPPVLEPREEINVTLSTDPGLDGFDEHHAKLACIDLSPNLKTEERSIVLREPNGVLRKAFWKERHRIAQVYYPVQGKLLEQPPMFEPEHMKDVLDREEYIYLLDRACLQYEPFDPDYIRITRTTYDRINENFHFSKLHSTRHFASMTFYLIVQKNIDNLMLDNLHHNRIDDVLKLLRLYCIIHPECKLESDSDIMDFEAIENFINLHSKKKDELQLALQTYLSMSKKEKSRA